ncbi:MAG TPA: alpha/beta hydrolase [Urbifossiella sp.]|jgi:hypothetical protein|nr:alpha/beta hydrolase [Urbifossiella sp.]
MAGLGTISVRTLPVGGAVAAAAALDPPGTWLQGHRHLVLLVHGFNVSQPDAEAAYALQFANVAPDVVRVLWPGDARGGTAASVSSYPFQIPSARDSAARLADRLRGLFGPGGGPAVVSIVGHSLGCRLALELLALVRQEPGSFPQVAVVALMAAAVPVALVDGGGGLVPAAGLPARLAVLHSAADEVLHLAFPTGQTTARVLGLDEGNLVFGAAPFNLAVGRFGDPAGLAAARTDMTGFGYGHGSYWGGPEAFNAVAPLFGTAAPRALPVRGTVTRSPPAGRPAAVVGGIISRLLPVRRLV